MPGMNWKEERIYKTEHDQGGVVNGIKPVPASPVDSKPIVAPILPLKPRKTLTASEHERVSRALASIEDVNLNNLGSAGFELDRARYEDKSKKRARMSHDEESNKRKVGSASSTVKFRI